MVSSSPHQTRFWEKVEKTENCWNWKGTKQSQGKYGQCWTPDKKKTGAHRFSYLISKGEIPTGMMICHTCDNGLCVNPDHLFLGTAMDNSRDMISKGRGLKGLGGVWKNPNSLGSKNGSAILTEDEVKEIKSMYRSGARQVDISKAMNISQSLTWRIVHEKIWKHIQ